MRAEPFDLGLVQRLETLQLRARYVMEGFLSGLNASPLKGFSAEFAEYRHYFPGDPLRLVDWKLFGRSDRIYVKQFEEETNLQCHIVLDLSGSMDFCSTGALFSKIDYATTVAAVLAHFLQRQKDAVGVTLCTQTGPEYLPARGSSAHLRQLMSQLMLAKAQGELDFSATVQKFGHILNRRSLVVLISDFYEDAHHLEPALRQLRYDHHDVLAFQILDPCELDFQFSDGRIFEDSETRSSVPIDPHSLRRDYLSALNLHLKKLRELMQSYDVDYHLFSTTESMEHALAAYLAKREGRV